MSRRGLRLALALALLATPAMGNAHPLAPALLELRELEADRYAVTWRTSVARAGRSDVAPRLPPGCTPTQAPATSIEGGEALVARWTVHCPQGLQGARLAVEGLERSGINVILRIETRDGSVLQALLDARETAYEVPAIAVRVSLFTRYAALGVEHLLLGLDHVLLVLGLYLLVRGLKPLLLTITAFTLGHSLTLGLASLGLLRVDPRLMELGIALSVLLLALELLAPTQGRRIFGDRPWRMAALFGLLHGLGFAAALAQAGLPAGELPLALFAFNAGIEAAQLALLAAFAAWGAFWRSQSAAPRPWLAALPAYAIGSTAAFWCLQRAGLLI